MQHLINEAGLAGEIEVDSAGTAAYHIGKRADARSRKAAKARGIELPSIARQFAGSGFSRFDYVLAMDQDNYDDLAELCETDSQRQRLALLRSFDSESAAGASVPDPYYGGPEGFTEVFEICEAACRGLLEHIKTEHGLK